MLARTKQSVRDTCSEAEWQARVDLAAIHRIAVVHGFSEGIRNHFTLSVPGEDDQVLIMPFGLHWSEVTASCFMVVRSDGTILRGEGEVERSTFCLHVPLHVRLPHAKAVLHTHMPYATALTRLKDPRLLPVGQTEVSLIEKIAYDPVYNGLGYEVEEGERIAEVMGDKSILFMAHHGVMVVGKTVSWAYDRLYYLERACQAQLHAMWTGQELKLIEPETIANTRKQYSNLPKYYGKTGDVLHLEALKRILDRTDPGYAD